MPDLGQSTRTSPTLCITINKCHSIPQITAMSWTFVYTPCSKTRAPSHSIPQITAMSWTLVYTPCSKTRTPSRLGARLGV